MKPKKDIFDLFRDSQHKLNERPSQEAWGRLERRLDQHKDRNRTSIYRILSMAAAVVGLVAFVSVISFMLNSKNEPMAFSESVMDSFSTEELKVLTVSNINDSQIAAYQKKYDHHLSSPIMEGKANKKLIARMDPQRRDGNLDSFVKKAKRDKERSLTASSVTTEIAASELQQLSVAEPAVTIQSNAAAVPDLIVYDTLVYDDETDADVAADGVAEMLDEDVAMAENKKEAKDMEAAPMSKAKRSYADEPSIEKADQSYEINKSSKISAAAGAGKIAQSGIEQFKWLTGEWEGNINNQVSVERWKQVDNQTLEGRGFLLVNGQSTFHENMKIQEIGGVVNFIADLNGTGNPIYYKLVSNDGFQAVFENKAINFPNQVVLQRTNSSNFQTIYQNTQPTNIGETQQSYYLNRNYIQKEQVIRNLRRVND